MARGPIPAILTTMKSSQQPGGLPLDYISELSFEIHLLRSECSEAAQRLMGQTSLDEWALEECALMDDALAQAKRVLDSSVARIKHSRKKRGKRAR